MVDITSFPIPTRPLSDVVSGKNKIINGNFDIWQRGTSHTTTGYGSADRWRNENVGTTKVASQQAFTLGQTDVPNNPTYFYRTVVTSVAGSGNYCTANQRIEGVNTFAGTNATLSFWAKADAAKDIAIEFLQNFGSGGSPSATVNGIGSQKVTLSTAWQKFEVTVAIPSITGKTLGTDGNDFLSVALWFDAGSALDTRTATLGQQSGTFDIAQVQLEAGDTATLFEQRPTGHELMLCQRYYYLHADGTQETIVGSGGYWSATQVEMVLQFPTEMRAVPTLSATSGAAAYTASSTGTSDPFNSLILNRPSKRNCLLYNNLEASGTVGAFARVYSAVSSVISFDAEL